MAIPLDFQKLTAAGHLTVLWALPNAFANPSAPTAAELNAALNMSVSISWNDFDAGVQASNVVDDPSIADVGNFQTRGAAQYGGGISFLYPQDYDDNSNNHSLVFDAISEPWTRGFLVMRIDGEKLTTLDFAEGDLVHVMDVQTDSQTDMVTGEEAFRYTVNFLQSGFLAVYTVVQGAVDSAVVVTGDTTAAPGDIFRANATVAGREYTNGVTWSSDDTDVATVSSAGVVTAIAAGSATISGTFTATGESDSITLVVS